MIFYFLICLLFFDWILSIVNFMLLIAGFCYISLKNVSFSSVRKLSYLQIGSCFQDFILRYFRIYLEFRHSRLINPQFQGMVFWGFCRLLHVFTEISPYWSLWPQMISGWCSPWNCFGLLLSSDCPFPGSCSLPSLMVFHPKHEKIGIQSTAWDSWRLGAGSSS